MLSNMKVYLINPPAPNGVDIVREGRCMQRKGAWTAIWSPISLALCAAVLEQNGFEVKLSDCIAENINLTILIRKIRNFKPELVILNTSTPSIDSDLAVVGEIKKNNPKIKIAVLGIHVTALPRESLSSVPSLDFVIRGEPEYIVLELAKMTQKRGNFDKIAGISWRKNKKIIDNPDRAWTKNLDELPFPAWHLINKHNYTMPFTSTPFFLVATGRGCPYQCTFCADHTYYGRRLRLRSSRKIVDELEHNQKTYQVSEFLFWSESFTINKKFAESVCDEIIRRRLRIAWVCNSRVDNVNLKLLKKFKKAGCVMIGYGIESGNQDILNNVKKGTTLKQARLAVECAHKAGLEVTGHCVVGLPGETKETIGQTVRFAKDISLDYAQFYCAVPFPGSEFYNLAKERGWIIDDDWSLYEQNFSVLNYGNLNAEKIMELRRQAYREFYFSPRVILRTLAKLRTPKDFLVFIKMVVNFLDWIR